MRDEQGRFFCDRCQERSAAGGLTVAMVGRVDARNVSTAADSLYCSERCLLEALLRARPGEDPVVAQQATIRSLQRRLGEARGDVEHADDRTHQYRQSLDEIAGLLDAIRDEELTRSVADDARGKRLRQVFDVMRRHVRH